MLLLIAKKRQYTIDKVNKTLNRSDEMLMNEKK